MEHSHSISCWLSRVKAVRDLLSSAAACSVAHALHCAEEPEATSRANNVKSIKCALRAAFVFRDVALINGVLDCSRWIPVTGAWL